MRRWTVEEKCLTARQSTHLVQSPSLAVTGMGWSTADAVREVAVDITHFALGAGRSLRWHVHVHERMCGRDREADGAAVERMDRETPDGGERERPSRRIDAHGRVSCSVEARHGGGVVTSI